ncbi:MAG: DNA mismatch repair endonuclease MutL [Termitinemataceae bacterium]|nr:MAG: DNA mismatch repair endonuclease MutL [Termitinemataceae bacterium]
MDSDIEKIQILPAAEAQKIAAGEVVDRPAALVREFVDNAIDSGATEIDVSIEEGGLKLTEVSDNGCGMSRCDLIHACLKYATSKITKIDDLQTLKTLGFRGEALSAAVAVSYLEIISSTDGKSAWKFIPSIDLEAGKKKDTSLCGSARRQGTTIRAHSIFDKIPARKLFLKNSSSEASYCKKIFSEKALAFPSIAFRFFQDGKLILNYPACGSLKKRFCKVMQNGKNEDFFHEIAAKGEHFSLVIVVGGPELPQQNRRLQFIYANGRRLNDFALQQALEYGTQGWFPNASHPAGSVFIEIDSRYADFNIHPAKLEARFSDPQAIHHCISSALTNFVLQHEKVAAGNISGNFFYDTADVRLDNPNSKNVQPQFAEKIPYKTTNSNLFVTDSAAAEFGKQDKLRYVGRIFDLFIVVEKGPQLFIIDQHAAHERLLYNHLLEKPIPKQELLVPIPFQTESEAEDTFLKAKSAELERLGIVIKGGKGDWRIEALPVLWRLGDVETVREIRSLCEAGVNVAEHWAATIACHAAIKDGSYIDNSTALSIAEESLSLPVMRCPHGRPFVKEITREELLKAVKRI